MARKIKWASAKPSPVVYALAAANVLCFVLTTGGRLEPSLNALVAAGALTKSALAPGERWHLVAAGFLHANVPHLVANLLSLLACGPTLERRLGSTDFILVYVVALLGSSIASVEIHGAAFVGVGASGAIIGLFGALFALWLLGKVQIHPRFFLLNFGLLGFVNVPGSHVDWAAHLGGFGGGLIGVALLDTVERVSNLCLRCRFPEFVKLNMVGLIGTVGALGWHAAASLDPAHTALVATALFCFSVAFALFLDFFLSLRRGLALVALLLGACNGIIAVAALISRYDDGPPADRVALDALLRPLDTGPGCVGLFTAVFALSLLLYAGSLRRGLADVGFTSAMLMASRRRERSGAR